VNIPEANQRIDANTIDRDDEYEYVEVVEEKPRGARGALLVILVLLVLLLAAVGYVVLKSQERVGGLDKKAQLSGGMKWVKSIYGYGPAENQQLSRPTDVAVAPDGTIWAVDGQHFRILAFTPDGKIAGHIGDGARKNAKGSFMNPKGVGVGPDGRVYVADPGRNVVLQFEKNGTYIKEWAVPTPNDVAISSDRIAVSSTAGVALFDINAGQVGLLGTRGKGTDQFDVAVGLEFGADGTLYIADTQNARVKAYDRSGKLLWISKGVHKFKPKGGEVTATEQLSLPAGVSLDGMGRVVLVDPFNFALYVLDPTQKGKFVATYGEFGKKDGYFEYPTGIGYDKGRDWFAVADTNNDRIQIVRIGGSSSNPAGAALRRATVGPVWLCCIPLFLLLAGAVLIFRRRRSEEPAAEPGDGC